MINELKNRLDPDENIGMASKKSSKLFTSWIDADYWLFGLIYFVLFEDKKVIINENLAGKIRKSIESKRNDRAYSKSPNRLSNLRDRVSESISIYRSCIGADSDAK